MFMSFSYRKNLSNVGYFSGSKKKKSFISRASCRKTKSTKIYLRKSFKKAEE